MTISLKAVAGAALAVSALYGGMTRAQTAPLTVAGGWEPFFYVNPNFPASSYGGPIYDYYTGDTDFTFTLTTPTDLNVTDLYYNLDRFDLTVDDLTTGVTTDEGETAEARQNFSYTDDPYAAFASPYFSHGSYLLGPGSYDVTGVATYSPYGEGLAAIEIAAIPEPATWSLMLVGFGILGGLGRRRARLSTATA